MEAKTLKSTGLEESGTIMPLFPPPFVGIHPLEVANACPRGT